MKWSNYNEGKILNQDINYEKNGLFELKHINLDKVEDVLNESILWNAVIVSEMISVFREYKTLN